MIRLEGRFRNFMLWIIFKAVKGLEILANQLVTDQERQAAYLQALIEELDSFRENIPHFYDEFDEQEQLDEEFETPLLPYLN